MGARLTHRGCDRGVVDTDEDIDRASQEVVSILAPLTQEGILAVPSLGGQVRAAPGFQLFLTQREQAVSGKEVLAKLVRTEA